MSGLLIPPSAETAMPQRPPGSGIVGAVSVVIDTGNGNSGQAIIGGINDKLLMSAILEAGLLVHPDWRDNDAGRHRYALELADGLVKAFRQAPVADATAAESA